MIPPSAAAYIRTRDDAIWQSVLAISRIESMRIHLHGDGRRIVQLPNRITGLGMQRAMHAAPTTHMASWIDALGTIKLRSHDRVAVIADAFSVGSIDGYLRQLQHALTLPRRDGYDSLSSWIKLADGKLPSNPAVAHSS